MIKRKSSLNLYHPMPMNHNSNAAAASGGMGELEQHYYSEDGILMNNYNGQHHSLNNNNNNGNAVGNKRVSFNRDVAIKRIPSILHHNRTNSNNVVPIQPAAVVVVFPSSASTTTATSNSSSSSSNHQLNWNRGGPGLRLRPGPSSSNNNLASLPSEQQAMLVAEARAVLEQMESISCVASSSRNNFISQSTLNLSKSRGGSYEDEEFDEDQEALFNPRPAPIASKPPGMALGRPGLRRSESVAGVFFSSKPNHSICYSPSRRFTTPPPPPARPVQPPSINHKARVVKKRAPPTRIPLFLSHGSSNTIVPRNNSLGESSSSCSSSSGSGNEHQTWKSKEGSSQSPPSWFYSSSASASASSASTPSPISSISSATSSISMELQKPKVGVACGKAPVDRPRIGGGGHGGARPYLFGQQSEDESTSRYYNEWTPAVPSFSTLFSKKREEKRGLHKEEAEFRHHVTTLIIGDESALEEKNEVKGGKKAVVEDEEELNAKYPLKLVATSSLDHPTTTNKPFFYGDKLPTTTTNTMNSNNVNSTNVISNNKLKNPSINNNNNNSTTTSTSLNNNNTPVKMFQQLNLGSRKPPPPPPPAPQLQKPLAKEQEAEKGPGVGFMSSLLRKKSVKLNPSNNINFNVAAKATNHGACNSLKRPTRVQSFLSMFGRHNNPTTATTFNPGNDDKKDITIKSNNNNNNNNNNNASLQKWRRINTEQEEFY